MIRPETREDGDRQQGDDRRLRPRGPAADAELAKPLGIPASTKGLLVTSVKEGSSAAEKGIQEGDVITSVIRNRRIQPMASVKAFQDLASKSNELALLRAARTSFAVRRSVENGQVNPDERRLGGEVRSQPRRRFTRKKGDGPDYPGRPLFL